MKEREDNAQAMQAGKNTGKRIEETLPHSKRIEIIYLSQVHGISIRKTAAMTQSHYSTVRSVMEAFKASGRTNKLLTYQSKSLILKLRNQKSLVESQEASTKVSSKKKRVPPKRKKVSDQSLNLVTSQNLSCSTLNSFSDIPELPEEMNQTACQQKAS